MMKRASTRLLLIAVLFAGALAAPTAQTAPATATSARGLVSGARYSTRLA